MNVKINKGKTFIFNGKTYNAEDKADFPADIANKYIEKGVFSPTDKPVAMTISDKTGIKV